MPDKTTLTVSGGWPQTRTAHIALWPRGAHPQGAPIESTARLMDTNRTAGIETPQRAEARLDFIAMALAEVVPGFKRSDVEAHHYDGSSVWGVRYWIRVEERFKRRARILGAIGHEGPTTLTICDRHAAGSPAMWATCERVPAREALVGRTCGAP